MRSIGRIAAVAVLGFVVFAAAETGKHNMSGKGMMESMHGMPMMGSGMMQMVPVTDGVVVLVGNKLIKFDGNLNKKSEAILEFDKEAAKKMMMAMQEMQTMHMEMMKEKKMEEKK